MSAHVLIMPDFKPGDPEPISAGYLQWHEWAEVQYKAGIRQRECGVCGKWKCPQDMSDNALTITKTNRRGKTVSESMPICKFCAVDDEALRTVGGR